MKTANKILTTAVKENCGTGYFNILAINDNGSPINTQVWDDVGSFDYAALRIKGWIAEGRSDSRWRNPIVMVYVHHTRTLDTHCFTPENDPHGLWS